MKRELIEKIFSAPHASANENKIDVTFSPRFQFTQGGMEVPWPSDIESVKCWMAEVKGHACVTKNSRVVISDRSRPFVSDMFGPGEPETEAQTVMLAPGTVVQAGITVIRRNGFRTVVAAVGMVPEPDNSMFEANKHPVSSEIFAKASDISKSHAVTIQLDGVIQMKPEDAALYSSLKQDITIYGPEHVRTVLDLAAEG